MARWGRAVSLGLAVGFAVVAFGAAPAYGQTDYYNLDKNRPLRVEDAYATERYAVEVQISPLALSGFSGTLVYEPSLELKYGLLPGMEMSAGLEAHVLRHAGETTSSLGQLELSTLYNLNSETLGIPALGIRLTGHVPLEGDESASLEIKGALTRVLGGPWRAHANGAWVLGEDAGERWWAGLAVDHVLPFRSMLLLAETNYARGRGAGTGGHFRSAAGMRYQLGPQTGMDLGGGVVWPAEDEPVEWHVTFGITRAVGFRSLIPGVGR